MVARDADATRARLLAAGLAEFSAKGIAGARVDAIAARAGVNKRMLYYYFDSKEGLFREILRQKLTERAESLREVRPGDPDRLVRRQRDYAADPDFVRLLLWEALEAGPTGTVVAEDERGPLYRRWVDRIAEAQGEGLVDAGLDPDQLALSELGLALVPFLVPQITRLLTGRAVDDPEFLARPRPPARRAGGSAGTGVAGGRRRGPTGAG